MAVELTPEVFAEVQKVFQSVYGSWAGTMIAGKRSDEDIRMHLMSGVLAAIDDVDGNGPAAAAERARRVILRDLPTIRKKIEAVMSQMPSSALDNPPQPNPK